jgi:putative addiction module component (TIGR02574 family)
MTTKSLRILDDALALSEVDRAELAGRLIESLDVDSDPDSERAWQAETAHRVGALDDGTVKPVSWNDLRRDLWERADGRPNG